MATINRINGIVSGFDTESLVKDLMKLEQTKVDKKYQQKQLLTWQKDAYKEFSSLLRGLQSEFFDSLKAATNLRGKTMFNVFSAGVTTGTGAASADVTAATTVGSVNGTIKLSDISQLASRDTWTSSAGVKALSGGAIDLGSVQAALALGKDTVKVTVDGNTKEITLAATSGDSMANLVSDIQSKLNTAFGANKVTVADGGGNLVLDSVGSVVSLADGDADILGAIGFVSGDGNALNMSKTLADAFGVADPVTFTINGVTSDTMGIKSTDTIKQMMDKINSSAAGVTVSYSSVTDKFTMQSAKEGVANNIELLPVDSGFFADKLGITTAGRIQGKDAVLTINGVATTRSSNTFQVDGTNITLKSKPADGTVINVGVTASPNAVMDTVKNFITKYNDLIEKIGVKTEEKRYRDYTPLTDEQKQEMSDDDIAAWETKAKSGLLRSDSTLRGIADKLRAAILEPVAGLGISLADIGISTSKNYRDKGKLVLDEDKLRTALTDRPNEVVELFTKESATAYTDTANRTTRYSENGWANRINDIIQDSIRLSTDSNGQKGLLIEKAGNEKMGAEIYSVLAKRIDSVEDTIAKMLDDMADKETRYYAQFTRMETALSRMNAQFSSVFGSMSGTS